MSRLLLLNNNIIGKFFQTTKHKQFCFTRTKNSSTIELSVYYQQWNGKKLTVWLKNSYPEEQQTAMATH